MKGPDIPGQTDQMRGRYHLWLAQSAVTMVCCVPLAIDFRAVAGIQARLHHLI
jgi:hypothetical protein